MKAFLITGSLLLIAVLLGAVVVPADMVSAKNGPITCAIQTVNGHYLTAVGGGGRTTDVIHTDATAIGTWEKFTLEDQGYGSPIHYGFRTANGHYLTAVGGGGRISDVIHSDATQVQAWEEFILVWVAPGVYGIQTSTGNYLTATGGGGHSTEVPETIHSDATKVLDWEKFQLVGCVSSAARTAPAGPTATPQPNKFNKGNNLNLMTKP
jgi:hypothetical protein